MNIEDISNDRPKESTENDDGGSGEYTNPAEKPVNDGGGASDAPAAGDSYTDP